MAFTGFDFRNNADGTGFTADPAGHTAVRPNTAVYSTAQGYGFNSGVVGASFASPNDPRLAGQITLSSSSQNFRADVPNGTYDVLIALGSTVAVTTGARVTYGGGANDYFEIDGSVQSGSANNYSSLDAQSNAVSDVSWVSTPVLRRVTVNNNRFVITRNNTTAHSAYLKHFSFQPVASPLGPVKIGADDGINIVNTTGDTTAGSAAVANIPAVAGLFVGMSVTGPAIPAGATIADMAAKNASTSTTTSLTLSTGTGVTALTGGALAIAWAPKLYEKSPANKIIGPVFVANGASNLAVTLADGVTLDPYLKIRTINGQPMLAYTGTPFPGTAGAYTFYIVQTDTSGNFTGSPYKTTVTLPVTFAPTKPVDGSFLSKISTPAFLMRKTILDKQAATRWPGHKGQTFNGGDALVNSLAGLFSQAAAFATSAGANKWFRIRCTNAATGGTAADWATAYSNTSFVASFQPENGGGLVIENDAGQNVRFDGSIYTGPQRGFQWRGLTFASISSIGMRIDYSDSKPLIVLRVQGCKFGYLWNPAYSESNYANDLAKSQNGVQIVGGADQATIVDNTFFGTRVGCVVEGTRVAEYGFNVFLRSNNDCMETQTTTDGKVNTVYQGAGSLADQDCYFWVHDNICYDHVDDPQIYPFNPDGSWSSPHGDFIQHIPPSNYRDVYPAFTGSRLWIVCENNILLNNITQYVTNTVNTSDTNKYMCSRQFNISNYVPRTNGVFINNIGLNAAGRGIDLGGAGETYTEYNTMFGAPVLPPGVINDPGILVGNITGPAGAEAYIQKTGKHRSRKNILGDNSEATPIFGLASEDDIIAKMGPGGPSPATAFTGPFSAASDGTGKLTFPVLDGSSIAPNAEKASIWAALKPLGDAGAQQVVGRLLPGDAGALSSTQAATLTAISEAQIAGVLSGLLSLRWNNGAGETGNQAGSDVTFTAQN